MLVQHKSVGRQLVLSVCHWAVGTEGTLLDYCSLWEGVVLASRGIECWIFAREVPALGMQGQLPFPCLSQRAVRTVWNVAEVVLLWIWCGLRKV